MNKEHLKPCPFCGAEAKRETLDSGEDFGGDVIACTKCKCSSRIEFGERTGLVEAWNARVTLPSDAAQAPLTAEQRHAIDKAAYMLTIFSGHDSGANLLHYFGKAWHHEAKRHAATLRAILAAPVAPAAAAQLSTEMVHKPVHSTSIVEHVEGNRTPIDGNQNNTQLEGGIEQ